MKLTKKEKEQLAESFNISLVTFYNWEKNKPRLMEIILLGLQKENEIKDNLNGFSNLDEAVGKMIPTIKALEEKIKALENKIK